MILERFLNGREVLVQGVVVYITPDAITQYVAAPDVQVNDDRGIEWIEAIDQYRGRLVVVLKMDGREEWNQLVKLYPRDLRLDAAFWNICTSYSLMPTRHRTKLFYEPARLLHSLVSRRLIDIGRVIFRDICHSGRDDTLSMMFSCLIIALCRNAGIDVDIGLEDHAPSVMHSQAMKDHMDLCLGDLEERMNTRFNGVQASIEEVCSMVSRFSVASGSGVPFQTSVLKADFHAGGGSGFYQ
ncbi:hypothetical protein Dsin_029122 [Dipteronia sinensis]|uniref:Putative plant transposon protein domain-containing protein n=1 Tax=Dipteronia sinensis TaxID=43782 RepID=A0AAD9ZTG7_9ROSI|nr:hypothetical protein Dsin_029122 [Dipteronia sinensis]